LVAQFRQWTEVGLGKPRQISRRDRRRAPGIIAFAANDDKRRELVEQLTVAIQGRYPVLAKTPLGFFQDEVMLFWPLLVRQLNLRAQFPLRLRPETEQELATQLWRVELDLWGPQLPGANELMRVRRLLDLVQLAAVSGTPLEDVPQMLAEGIPSEEGTTELWQAMGQMLLDWRSWCLGRGLLTYGIICELYWRYLLPDPTYQSYLQQRFQGILADDVDDYPTIARDLFDRLLDGGATGLFTYNPNGQVRLGLNADPDYMEGLAGRCQIEALTEPPRDSLASSLGDVLTEIVSDPMFLTGIPESVQAMQTTSRAALLRQTAQVIIEAVRTGQVEPREIAIIAPGLDAIARYTLTEILTAHGIPVEPLNAQRPLNSSPTIRALLTLLALVYPGLGRLVDRDAVAEMLVVLGGKAEGTTAPPDNADGTAATHRIDPVRAGLLADHCYVPDPENPHLLPADAFPRWDRLGHRATAAYTEIVQWLAVQREQQRQGLISACIVILDRAIQKFLWNGSNLPYDAIAALRELMETTQHYWEVDGRLRQTPLEQDEAGVARAGTPPYTTLARFIQLLRRGTVTANPYPIRRQALPPNAITLATIFQYRSSRQYHRWHFWLDAGSSLWLSGGAATLFGAPIFLQKWSGRPWTEEDKLNADEQRLQRILRDLLGRAGERIYLCHSDLAVNGTEQNGPLLTLVHTAVPLAEDAFAARALVQ
jgi:hypothetical protein